MSMRIEELATYRVNSKQIIEEYMKARTDGPRKQRNQTKFHLKKKGKKHLQQHQQGLVC